MAVQTTIAHSTPGSTLADILERILDKGLVIAGDIRIKLVDIELLTIQIRLVICSVEKAREIGLDWWANNSAFRSSVERDQVADSLSRVEERLAKLECATPVTNQSQAE